MSLYKPLQIGSTTVKHRIAMAPLTRLRCDNNSQIPPIEAAQYYGDRAQYEGTLIVSEATSIAPQAVGHFHAPGIWSPEQIESWSRVTKAVHAKGSFIYLQLWAHGRAANEKDLKRVDPSYEVVSSGDVAVPGMATPRPLRIEEIKEYVQWYVQAARNALEAGFDGVEIHSANGYLLNQFLHEGVNNRTDEYGGTIENRSRFTLEVVDAIVAAIGADKVGIRFNPWGGLLGIEDEVSPLPQYSHVISELEKRAKAGNRLSYIHVMEPRVDFKSAEGTYGPVDREANHFVRQIWGGNIIRCGSFGKDTPLMQRLTEADDKLVIGIGRLFISNPDLVQKLKDDVPPDMFVRGTFYWDPASDVPLTKGYTEDFVRKPSEL